MSIDHQRLNPLREGQGEIPQHVIDEFVGGRISRRTFIKRGTAVGLSLPLVGAILEACGSNSPKAGGTSTTTASAGKSGATIRAGIEVPAEEVTPIKVADTGGLEILDQVGEFLIFSDNFKYQPWLATSWTPNSDGSVWTFKIRQGVKFNDGTPMTVDDVVYSFSSQANPKNGGNALSVFGGLLSPDGVMKVDDSTVAFHLDAADGGFPDAVSCDNYNMIIVPNGFDYSTYQTKMPGTGHFMLESYTPEVGANFVRNPHYWGTAAKPSRLEFVFYSAEPAMTTALQANNIDCNDGFSVAVSPQLLNGSYSITALKATLNRQLSMRCDTGPWTNKLVRQAMALTLDRPAIVDALFKGYAVVGNDSPFCSLYPSSVGPPTVPQRAQNLSMAKSLMSQAGMSRGFSTTLYTETTQEMPRYAQILKQSAKALNIDINLVIEDPSKYYGSAVFGKSDWLDGQMSLVDYGARAVPNLFLEAPLQSIKSNGQGAWNAAHFDDSTYDTLSKKFIAAVDLSSQKMIAEEIEKLLLDETPIIFSYFYDVLVASQKNVFGVQPTLLGLFFWNATKT